MTASLRLVSLIALALAAFPGVAAAQDMPTAPACIVVTGGGGSKFADPRMDKFWLEMNRLVTNQLLARLQQGGYASSEAFEELADRGQTPQKALVGLSRTGCSYLLQVTDEVAEDANGKFFAFDVLLMHIVGADGAPLERNQSGRTVPDLNKRYRHARTAEEMGRFNAENFADQVFADLQASGKIEFARTGVMPPPDAPQPAAAPVGEPAPLDPKLVARAYDAFVVRWQTLGAKEAHVRHILLASEADARAAIARIQGGADFAAVARELSADQASREQGGDLGWNPASAFAPDVGRLVKSLEPQGLGAQPVHSALGWEIVDVLEVRPAPTPSFDAIRPKLEASLRSKLAARAASAAR